MRPIYKRIKIPDHHRANVRGEVLEHILIAERALGRPLPPKVVIHHHDRNGLNNAGLNMVICPDQGYHLILHARMRAIEACGNANWKRCLFCKRYDDPANMSCRRAASKPSPQFYHLTCNTNAARAWKARQ